MRGAAAAPSLTRVLKRRSQNSTQLQLRINPRSPRVTSDILLERSRNVSMRGLDNFVAACLYVFYFGSVDIPCHSDIGELRLINAIILTAIEYSLTASHKLP